MPHKVRESAVSARAAGNIPCPDSISFPGISPRYSAQEVGMKPIVALLLLSAAMAWAQQPSNQGQYPTSTPPAMAPESGQQPTPTPSRQDKASVNSQIRDNIRSALSGDPILSGTNVEVNVDDVNI